MTAVQLSACDRARGRPPEAPTRKDTGPPSYEELLAEKVRLRVQVADFEARIAELEGRLEESRRSDKRQATPFSKGPNRGRAVVPTKFPQLPARWRPLQTLACLCRSGGSSEGAPVPV